MERTIKRGFFPRACFKNGDFSRELRHLPHEGRNRNPAGLERPFSARKLDPGNERKGKAGNDRKVEIKWLTQERYRS